MVDFYELTCHAPALKWLSRRAFYLDRTVTKDGVICKTGWKGHEQA